MVWAELISEVFGEEDESESSAGAVESFSCWRCKADKGSVSERGRCCGNNVLFSFLHADGGLLSSSMCLSHTLLLFSQCDLYLRLSVVNCDLSAIIKVLP